MANEKITEVSSAKLRKQLKSIDVRKEAIEDELYSRDELAAIKRRSETKQGE